MNLYSKVRFLRTVFCSLGLLFAAFFLAHPPAEAGHLDASDQTSCLAGTLLCDPKSQTCPKEGGLVPCGRFYDNPDTLILECEDCNFCHFFYLFDNIVNFIMWRLVPVVATLAVAAAGFFFAVSRANASHLSIAKNLLIWTFGGWAVIFISWMVINSFLSTAGVKKWTGLAEESGEFTGGNCSSFPTKCEEFADGSKNWTNDEWAGVVVTLKHPELKPKTAVVKTNNNQWLTLKTPIDTEGKGLNTFSYTIAGWWNFSCGVTVSPIPSLVVVASPVVPPAPLPPKAMEDPAPTPAAQPNPQIGQWTNYARLGPWITKQNHATVVFTDSDGKEKIWVIGGYGKEAEGEVFAFDGVKWEPKPPLPGPRGDLAAVVFTDSDGIQKIWAIGGRDLLNNPTGDMWTFNPQTQTWETDNPGVTGIHHHAAVVFMDKIWIIGGYKRFLGKENQVWSCTATTCTWDDDFDFPEDGIVDHAAIIYDDGSGEKIWIIGGREGEGNERKVWTFDGIAWVKKADPDVPTGLEIPGAGITGGHTAMVFDDSDNATDKQIWVVGGRQGRAEENRFWTSGGSNVWTFDGTTWTVKATIPIKAGWTDHSAVVFKDPRDDKKKVWIIGGMSGRGSGTYSNDLWLFTPPDSILPVPPAKKVFVTSAVYPADLREPDPDDPAMLLGGLESADLKCSRLGLGNYKAWLSDRSVNPDSNFTKSNGPYELINDIRIADNWIGIVDGYLKMPINVTEGGTTVSNRYVWTGTTMSGKAHLNGQFCNDWTTNRSKIYPNAQLGNADLKDPRWSEGATNIYCATDRSLYCFEQ